MMPPPKKGRGGLIAIISIVVVVVIIGAIVAVVVLGGKKGGTTGNNNASSTPTAPPTPSVPSGFTKFTGTDFSVIYPSDWMKEADTQGTGAGEDFTGTAGQTFQISIDENGATADQIPLLLTTFCSILGNDKATPTPVTIGGQQWEQIDCGNTPTLHAVSDAIYYKNALYQITYGSITDTYDNDKTQYFSVMESSFTFLT